MEPQSRQLRLVLATGFTRRRQVAVPDQALRPGGVEGGIIRSDRGQPVDVPVEQAKQRRDQNGVVDLQVSRVRRRARATSSAVTSSPPCCTAAAIASKAFSLAGTGARLASDPTVDPMFPIIALRPLTWHMHRMWTCDRRHAPGAAQRVQAYRPHRWPAITPPARDTPHLHRYLAT